jgi:hypothetical protein
MLTTSISISETNHAFIKAHAKQTGVSFSQAIVTLALQALPDKNNAAFAAAVGESVRHVVRGEINYLLAPLAAMGKMAATEAGAAHLLTEEIVRFWLREAARQSTTTDEFIEAHLLSMEQATFTDYEIAVERLLRTAVQHSQHRLRYRLEQVKDKATKSAKRQSPKRAIGDSAGEDDTSTTT